MAPFFIAPYPPLDVRNRINSQQWALCIESWLLHMKRLLSCSSQDFSALVEESCVAEFLATYVMDHSSSGDDEASSTNPSILRRHCFLLIYRIFSETKPISILLLNYSFLTDLSIMYNKSRALRSLLERVWTGEHLEDSNIILKSKAALSHSLETAKDTRELHDQLLRAVAFAKTLPLYGQYLLIGSDFTDSMSHCQKSQKNPAVQRKLVVLTYTCLTSLLALQEAKISLLDQLYNLHQTPLMKAVIESTPFFAHLEKFFDEKGTHSERAKPLLYTLSLYKPTSSGRSRRSTEHRLSKGKKKALTVFRTADAHRMSSISQIQDLFPDLGSGFIAKLLDEYQDDTEQVTAHLLDNNLPSYLQGIDKSETLPLDTPWSDPRRQNLVPDPTSYPIISSLPTRRNIHDNDDFDRLAVSTSQIHLGRKNADQTADDLLAASKFSSNKAAIISALSAFDLDDDERDDTYDIADVGGTVDTTFGDSDTDTKQGKKEEVLYVAYKADPDVFSRDAKTRHGSARAALRNEVRMTDEAIEGWAIMARRDPKRLRRLERLHDMSRRVQQQALSSTAWKADSGAEEAEDSGITSSEEIGGRGGRGRGRGRDRGSGRGRGGNVGGQSIDQETQVARDRKNTGKASCANHNRRNQRAKKMARGGGMAG